MASSSAATPHNCPQNTERLSQSSDPNRSEIEIAGALGQASLLEFLDSPTAYSAFGREDVQVGLPILCHQELHECATLCSVSNALESSLGCTSISKQIQIEEWTTPITEKRQQGQEGSQGIDTTRDGSGRLHHVHTEDAMGSHYTAVTSPAGRYSRRRREPIHGSSLRSSCAVNAASNSSSTQVVSTGGRIPATVDHYEETTRKSTGRDGRGVGPPQQSGGRSLKLRDIDSSAFESASSLGKSSCQPQSQDSIPRQRLAGVCSGRESEVQSAQGAVQQASERSSEAFARKSDGATTSPTRNLQGIPGAHSNPQRCHGRSIQPPDDGGSQSSANVSANVPRPRSCYFGRWLPGCNHGGLDRGGRWIQSTSSANQALCAGDDLTIKSPSVHFEASGQGTQGTKSKGQRQEGEREQGGRYRCSVNRSLDLDGCSACGLAEPHVSDSCPPRPHSVEIACTQVQTLQAASKCSVSTTCFTIDTPTMHRVGGSDRYKDAVCSQSNDCGMSAMLRDREASATPTRSRRVHFAPWVECRQFAHSYTKDVVMPLESSPDQSFHQNCQHLASRDQDVFSRLGANQHPFRHTFQAFIAWMDVSVPWGTTYKGTDNAEVDLPRQDLQQEDPEEESLAESDPAINDYVEIDQWRIHKPLITGMQPTDDNPIPLISFGIRGVSLGRRNGNLQNDDPAHVAQVLWELWQDEIPQFDLCKAFFVTPQPLQELGVTRAIVMLVEIRPLDFVLARRVALRLTIADWGPTLQAPIYPTMFLPLVIHSGCFNNTHGCNGAHHGDFVIVALNTVGMNSPACNHSMHLMEHF